MHFNACDALRDNMRLGAVPAWDSVNTSMIKPDQASVMMYPASGSPTASQQTFYASQENHKRRQAVKQAFSPRSRQQTIPIRHVTSQTHHSTPPPTLPNTPSTLQ
jgi:hypothetical protein